MELEYEIEKVLEEDEAKRWNYCPSCGTLIIGNYCNKCKKPTPTEKYYDPSFEEYFERAEAEGAELKKELEDPNQWKEA